MVDFCAIDFETATHEPNSACELGICIVENGTITRSKSWLIKPPSFPYFNPRLVEVHGITPNDVQHAPYFDQVWEEINSELYGHLLIAHNASFDMRVLKGTLEYYGLFAPRNSYLCSVGLSKKSWRGMASYGLKNLCTVHGIKFNHHRAEDDAYACAQVALLAFERLLLTCNEEVYSYCKNQIKKL